jgi:hypothetical protein
MRINKRKFLALYKRLLCEGLHYPSRAFLSDFFQNTRQKKGGYTQYMTPVFTLSQSDDPPQ